MGVNLADFWHLTPHTLQLIAEGFEMAYKRQIERENAIAHLQGIYITEALMATVGNMFSGKNSKKYEYPNKPYDLNLDKHDNDFEEDKERNKQLELFAASLTARMNNFNLHSSHSQEQGQS